MKGTPKTPPRKPQRKRLTVAQTELVTLGQQMRNVRELRGLSKEECARQMGNDTGVVNRIETGFIEGISFRTVHKYMQVIYATLVAIPMPFPSFIDHKAHRVAIYSPSFIPVHKNLKED